LRVGCAQIKERYSGIRHKPLADVRDKRSLIFYCDMKFKWVREVYTGCCMIDVRSGVAKFKAAAWKMTGTRKRFEEG
jgi:hypothetical protein